MVISSKGREQGSGKTTVRKFFWTPFHIFDVLIINYLKMYK